MASSVEAEEPLPVIPPIPEPVLPNPLHLKFTPYAWAKLAYAVTVRATEVGAMVVTSRYNPLLIEDVRFIKQYASAAFVRLDDDAVADFVADMGDPLGQHRMHPANFAYIFVHTHPPGMNRPSGHDETTFRTKFGAYPWSIMFILTRDLKTYCRLHIKKGEHTLDVEIPVSVDYMCSFPPSNHEMWEVELQNLLPSSADPYSEKRPEKVIEIPTVRKQRKDIEVPLKSEAVKPSSGSVLVGHIASTYEPEGGGWRESAALSPLAFLAPATLQRIQSGVVITPEVIENEKKLAPVLANLARLGVAPTTDKYARSTMFTLPAYVSKVNNYTINKCVSTFLKHALTRPMSPPFPEFVLEFAKHETRFIAAISLWERMELTKKPLGRRCFVTCSYERMIVSWMTIDGIRVFLTGEESDLIDYCKRTGNYDELNEIVGKRLPAARMPALSLVEDDPVINADDEETQEITLTETEIYPYRSQNEEDVDLAPEVFIVEYADSCVKAIISFIQSMHNTLSRSMSEDDVAIEIEKILDFALAKNEGLITCSMGVNDVSIRSSKKNGSSITFAFEYATPIMDLFPKVVREYRKAVNLKEEESVSEVYEYLEFAAEVTYHPKVLSAATVYREDATDFDPSKMKG